MAQKCREIYLFSPSPREGTVHLPMIEFEVVAREIDFSTCDTLMFSSKQAVKSADMIDQEWKKLPCIAIGSATKKQIEELGGEVMYHPKEFYADTLARDIVDRFADLSILYLRPQEVSFDSKGFLARAGITLQEQIIYKTHCKAYQRAQKPPSGSICVFTSPSSIHCFLDSFEWDDSYTAIVIGRATLVHLPKNAKYEVADRPLIDACVAKAREIQSY